MRRQKGNSGILDIDPGRFQSLLDRTSFGNGGKSFKRVKRLRNRYLAEQLKNAHRKTVTNSWQENAFNNQQSSSSFSRW